MDINTLAARLNREYPTRDWDQQCQRLVWNAIYFLLGYTSDSQMRTYATATAARVASRIESTDASKAPVGAIHYWRNPAEGHVGISLGGGRVLMTGTPGKVPQQLGKNYGITTVAHYTSAAGNPYLGWARTNGGNASIIGRLSAGASAASGSSASKDQWRTIQSWLKRLGRYSGPVDGVPGPNTWKGIQATVKKYGYYSGPVDGGPGANTYKGMQRYARAGGGYTGPVDGILGPNSWAGFVRRLSS